MTESYQDKIDRLRNQSYQSEREARKATASLECLAAHMEIDGEDSLNARAAMGTTSNNVRMFEERRRRRS